MTVTLARNDFKIVIKNVPSMICKDCSEEYVSEEISASLLNIANESIKKGKSSKICDFTQITPIQ
jgi:hypothetical protein